MIHKYQLEQLKKGGSVLPLGIIEMEGWGPGCPWNAQRGLGMPQGSMMLWNTQFLSPDKDETDSVTVAPITCSLRRTVPGKVLYKV